MLAGLRPKGWAPPRQVGPPPVAAAPHVPRLRDAERGALADECVRRHLAGESAEAIAAAVGYRRTSDVLRVLRRRRVKQLPDGGAS